MSEPIKKVVRKKAGKARARDGSKGISPEVARLVDRVRSLETRANLNADARNSLERRVDRLDTERIKQVEERLDALAASRNAAVQKLLTLDRGFNMLSTRVTALEARADANADARNDIEKDVRSLLRRVAALEGGGTSTTPGQHTLDKETKERLLGLSRVLNDGLTSIRYGIDNIARVLNNKG